MSQETVVLQLAPAAGEQLRARLARPPAGPFEQRDVPHAVFSVKGEGVVATLYRSGKLVVQGRDPAGFLARHLGRRQSAGRPAAGGARLAADRALVGCDEAGKGDYFGPLVAVALRASAEEREELRRAGWQESKRVSDERALRLGAALQGRFVHAVELLEPPEYNRAWSRGRNLNPLLADLHQRAVQRIARPGDLVLVDRFADEKLLRARLRDLEVELHQWPRAEADPTVAAASLIARAVFLARLRELSQEWAVDLHKGAGAPTDASARRFVALHGRPALENVAKLHFRNTAKLVGER